jgi:N-acetylglucosaminyldiphosphoundecaprenol N-acetyl-beta-D-mannosaminyltransferase
MASSALSNPALPSPGDFLGCPLHPVTTEDCIAFLLHAAATSSTAAAATTAAAAAGAVGTAAKPPSEQGEATADSFSPRPPAPVRVAYLNAHTSNLAARLPALRTILGRCDLVYADGQAVVWGARLLGLRAPERVNAGDFIVRFFRECAARGIRLYLVGGAPGLAARAGEAWQRLVPGLRIAGTRDGYFAADEAEAVARAIRDSGAEVVLVGMGSPRQEEWMDRCGGETGARVVWSVGALFEYFAGERRRAPQWMRRCGLEWLFRLALEPGRLWRRYLVGNVRFCLRVARARLHRAK